MPLAGPSKSCCLPVPSLRKSIAAADAFQKRQQATYDANVQKADEQLKTSEAPPQYGQPEKPKTPEERAINRCITSGRLPASCTGNALLGAFSQMLTSVLPTTDANGPAPGPIMAGVYEGAGGWRLDFIDGGVLVNCSYLSPDQHFYKLDFNSGRATLTIDTTPRPLVLALHGSDTITGPGPVIFDGVIANGSSGSAPDPNARSGYTDQNGIFAHQPAGRQCTRSL
jgi:hypothetical protein